MLYNTLLKVTLVNTFAAYDNKLILTHIHSMVQGGAWPCCRLFINQYTHQLDSSSNTGESCRSDF
jgi:hypothetical protein